MLFQDYLKLAGLSIPQTALALHKPSDPVERGALCVIAAEAPDLFNAYQSTHPALQEATLKKRSQLASFVYRAAGEFVFVGLFAQQGWRDRTAAELDADPLMLEMIARLGNGWSFSAAVEKSGRTGRAHFDLTPIPQLSELRGRLVVADPSGRNYLRRAETTPLEVLEITRRAGIVAPMPDWTALCLTSAELGVLPRDWAARLREWRGIYLIVDQADGARYVGAAYGQENLFGRWKAHVAGDFGVTRELAKRKTANFRFSILQRLSPDASIEDVTATEQGWINRLHTREFGLNA